MKLFKKKVSSLVILVVLVCSMFISMTNAASTTEAKKEVYTGTVPKYIFMFIGDGMSFPQVAATEMYLGKKAGKTDIVGGGGIEQLSFSKFPVVGTSQTFDASSFIPDSASTATSLASGYKTLSGVVNMDVNKKVAYKPITESLAAKGYKIGIVSSVPINHATPAAYYSKVPSRNDYYDIAKQLGDSGFSFFGGGGFLEPNGKDGKQEDITAYLKNKGYTVLNKKSDITKLNSKNNKVVAINPVMSVDGTSLPFDIDRQPGELGFSDYVQKAVDVCDNSKGFFIMAEGGKIDWANHANDGAASIQDTLAFSKGVQKAVDFYNKHPKETLILVTGDHECGGMTIGFAATGYSTFFDKIEKSTISYEVFDTYIIKPYVKSHKPENAKIEDLFPEIANAFGLNAPTGTDADKTNPMVLTAGEIEKLRSALKQTMTPSKERKYGDQESIMYGTYEPLSVTLTHIVNNKAGLNFSTYSHTGMPTPVFAYGAGQNLFEGFFDNTDVYKKLAAITKIN